MTGWIEREFESVCVQVCWCAGVRQLSTAINVRHTGTKSVGRLSFTRKTQQQQQREKNLLTELIQEN